MYGKVSVIMPSYNTGRHIAQSINSVLSQTYRNWELLIADDCSTDNTPEIVSAYLSDERIHYFQNGRNSGAAVSRNFALRTAVGKWIAFLDSDDLWRPEKLEKQLQFMAENRCYFSYTNYSEMDESGVESGIEITGPKRISRAGFLRYCWPGCLTVMYDRDAVGLVQIADIRKNNDYAMWLEVSKKADCYLLDENLALYRRGRAGSVSTHSLFTMVRWHYRLFREAEKENALTALFHTGQNLAFGLYKKVCYRRKA